jgi:hypothetical protein
MGDFSDETLEYAKYIGLDPVKDFQYMYIAKEGLNAPLPGGWGSAVDVNTNDIYYFKHRSGDRPPIVTWEHPKDEFYKEVATQIRRQREAKDYKDRLETRKKLHSQNKKSVKELSSLMLQLKQSRKLRENMISKKPQRTHDDSDYDVNLHVATTTTTDHDNDTVLHKTDMFVPSFGCSSINRKSKYKLNRITSPILLREDDFLLSSSQKGTHRSRSSDVKRNRVKMKIPISKNDDIGKDLGSLHFESLGELTIEKLKTVEQSLKDYIKEKNNEIIFNLERKIELQDELKLLKQRADETTRSLMNAVNK